MTTYYLVPNPTNLIGLTEDQKRIIYLTFRMLDPQRRAPRLDNDEDHLKICQIAHDLRAQWGMTTYPMITMTEAEYRTYMNIPDDLPEEGPTPITETPSTQEYPHNNA